MVVWDGFSECGKAEPAVATPAQGVVPLRRGFLDGKTHRFCAYPPRSRLLRLL